MSRRTVAGAALGIALVVAACGDGSDGDGESSGANPPNDPAATFATVPDTVLDTTTQTASTDADAGPTTTIPLEPAANVDLPTASPEELANGPSTTLATGPLPVPSVALVEVAEFDTPVELTTRPGDVRSFVVEQGGRVSGL